jgi:zinc D-Ala-D-Ala carboxypeptidase
MPTAMISEHFSWAEFLYSQTAAREGIPNVPDAAARANLEKLADVMEKIRSLLGDHPITISSGYRSPAVNAAVGGSSTSAHMTGLAADFLVPGFGTSTEVCKAIEPHMKELGIDQNIDEYPSTGWTHIGLAAAPAAPRCECLTISSAGTVYGFA